MVLQKRKAADGAMKRVGFSSASLGDYWPSYPTLVEFLTCDRWPDGAPRSTGTMMVFVEDGLWKCWLNDRDAAQGTFVSSPTIDGLLKAADGCINDPGHPWRASKNAPRKRS